MREHSLDLRLRLSRELRSGLDSIALTYHGKEVGKAGRRFDGLTDTIYPQTDLLDVDFVDA